MLPFFRKIRYRLAEDNQFLKYSRYAIGEIVLVVVGILIALYINNWNEQRKEQNKFNIALKDVEKELIDNISWLRVRANDLAIQDSISLKYYIDSVKFENYGLYFFIIGPWARDQIRNKSIEQLAHFKDLTDAQDSIMNELIDLEREFSQQHIDEYGETFIRIVNDRYESFQKYEWYDAWIKNHLSTDDKIIDFVMNDPDYSKMFFNMNDFNYAYRLGLGIFERKAISTYTSIYNYLEKVEQKHSDSLLFQYNADNYDHYLGKYESKWCSFPNYIHADSIAVKIEGDKLFWYGYRSDGPDNIFEIIPMNKYRFRDERMAGIYHLEFDDLGEVEGIRFSAGPGFILDVKKIR